MALSQVKSENGASEILVGRARVAVAQWVVEKIAADIAAGDEKIASVQTILSQFLAQLRAERLEFPVAARSGLDFLLFPEDKINEAEITFGIYEGIDAR